jgi:hypothetical protein
MTSQRALLQDLRIDSHAWYHRAHRFVKVVRTGLSLRKFECRQVTIVRSHLLEHPEEAATRLRARAAESP